MKSIETFADAVKLIDKQVSLVKTFGFDSYAQKHVDKLKQYITKNIIERNKVVCTNDRIGGKTWHINGKPHREDGPAAIDQDGNKYWYINGKRHRKDGPAIEYADGTKEWWLNGIAINPEEIIGNKYMEQKYPELIKSMIASQVHEK